MINIYIFNTASFNIWEAVSAVGTVGACFLALIPLIKENWRRIWLKIYSARLTGCFTHSYVPEEKVFVENLSLALGIKNRKNFDIGIQMAHLIIYKKKKKFFDKREQLILTFGTMERYPTMKVPRMESNEFYLNYNKEVMPSCYLDLISHRIPKETDISKIKIELYTTLRNYLFTVPRKDIENLIEWMKYYGFKLDSD